MPVRLNRFWVPAGSRGEADLKIADATEPGMPDGEGES